MKLVSGQARRFIPGGSPAVPAGEHRSDPEYRSSHGLRTYAHFQARSHADASTTKARTPTSDAPDSSHKLLSPARRAGVDQQAAPDAAPLGAHMAESNFVMVVSEDELPGYE